MSHMFEDIIRDSEWKELRIFEAQFIIIFYHPLQLWPKNSKFDLWQAAASMKESSKVGSKVDGHWVQSCSANYFLEFCLILKWIKTYQNHVVIVCKCIQFPGFQTGFWLVIRPFLIALVQWTTRKSAFLRHSNSNTPVCWFHKFRLLPSTCRRTWESCRSCVRDVAIADAASVIKEDMATFPEMEWFYWYHLGYCLNKNIISEAIWHMATYISLIYVNIIHEESSVVSLLGWWVCPTLQAKLQKTVSKGWKKDRRKPMVLEHLGKASNVSIFHGFCQGKWHELVDLWGVLDGVLSCWGSGELKHRFQLFNCRFQVWVALITNNCFNPWPGPKGQVCPPVHCGCFRLGRGFVTGGGAGAPFFYHPFPSSCLCCVPGQHETKPKGPAFAKVPKFQSGSRLSNKGPSLQVFWWEVPLQAQEKNTFVILGSTGFFPHGFSKNVTL